MVTLIAATLLTLLAVITVTIVFQRSLLGVVILSGIYSFLMASLLVVLDAVDVAMTEASVGAGISTVILLATLHLTKTREYAQPRTALLPVFVSGVVGAAIIYGTLGLPPFGVADSPIHQHVAPHYLQHSEIETHVPNVVTAILADYRGYDTLGEVTVIFTGAMGVLALLKRRRKDSPEDRDARL
jgi:multicomponent Na+:H+ antiporter subunit B